MPLPLMPGGPMETPMAAPPESMGMGAPPAGGGDMGGLMALLGGQQGAPMGQDPSALGPMGGGADPNSALMMAQQTAMDQFMQLEQLVMSLAGIIPGSEQLVRDIMTNIQLWKQQAIVGMTQSPASMMGASQMM